MSTDYRFKETDIVVIATDGEKFPFWSDILAENSQVLAKTFEHKMKEAVDKRVDLDGTDDEIRQFLAIIHPIKADPITRKNVYIILRLAHTYMCDGLLNRCLDILEGLHKENTTITSLVNQILDLERWIKVFQQDQKLVERLDEILWNPLLKISNSTDLDLANPCVSRLPKDYLVDILVCLYALRKRDTEKVKKKIPPQRNRLRRDRVQKVILIDD